MHHHSSTKNQHSHHHAGLPIRNVTTQSDYEELKKAYQFVLPTTATTADTNNGTSAAAVNRDNEQAMDTNNNTNHPRTTTSTSSSSWQDRMVVKYHSHLYKSHVIADFSQQQQQHQQLNSKNSNNNIGLRWRTKQEVIDGYGFDTCGNKHCLCYFFDTNDNGDDEQCDGLADGRKMKMKKKKKKKAVKDVIRWKQTVENRTLLNEYEQQVIRDENDHEINQLNDIDAEKREKERIKRIPPGLGLFDYTVHFRYVEHNQMKEELVQLKLCLQCAPKLFLGKGKGGVLGALRARRESNGNKSNHGDNGDNDDGDSDNESQHSSSDEEDRSQSPSKTKDDDDDDDDDDCDSISPRERKRKRKHKQKRHKKKHHKQKKSKRK